ncbi:biliverdin-producing heme oxygenase [Fulvivirga sp. M361]|uniref:biliverdin-producing heme oxygenase n=1 Tax=Fulvivirga sp. M361 TaxID=2594266 RepID=UPI0016272DF1|nr:biliverdin-producing heme oxygenase [Fulvivirga sp. M361]
MILDHIKTYTAGFHESLEVKLGAVLFKPNLLPSEYHQLIAKFYYAYSQLEHSINAVQEIRLLLNDRTKIPLLKKDLSYMESITGMKLSDSDLYELAAAENYGIALGMLYVMEGATLGGKYIVGGLRKLDWMVWEECLNFFNSYGDQRGVMWKKFTNYVMQYAEDNPREHQQILKGARVAFGYMNIVFD